MTLQQLKYTVTVAETGTITEAADRLYISQPSLTNAIHELEKEMNLQIFNRTNRGIFLSKEGEDLDIGFNAKYVLDVMKSIDDEEVYMYFNTPITPCLVEPIEGEAFEYLILPVRITNN